MEKLKNILKSDTPTTANEPTESGTSTTGRLAGQGSHFPSKDANTTFGLGSTATGPANTSAASASSTSAATTRGPEQGGTSHVNTTADQGSGTAAIGQTSTYTTSHLSKGDPTSSVVDSQSTDPLTYQRPEAGAATAASLAFARGEDRKKEAPGHENPYRADHLDPRVDGLSKDSAPVPTSTSRSAHDSSLGSTTTPGSGSGLAGAGAASALTTSKDRETSTPSSAPTGGESQTHASVVPSSLTTTADPVSRSAEYQAGTEDKGLGSSATGTADDGAAANQQSVVGRVLGAVGLGGVFGAGAASSTDSSAIADSRQPTTTTGIETYNAPTREGPPTRHHRKESIPTTAYPSATFDSPRAINAPIGGAGSPVIHGDQSSHHSRDVAVGAVAGAAATGAAAIGAHEYSKGHSATTGASSVDTAGQQSSRLGTFHDATTIGGDSTNTAAPSSLPILGSSTSTSRPTEQSSATGIASTGTATGLTGHTSTSTSTRGDISETPQHATTTGLGSTSTTAKTVDHPTTTSTTAPDVAKDRYTSSNDAALGTGAGVAAAGAGAYGAHEYSNKEAEKAEKEAAKEERHHQKELEKEERHHQKELEKEEKKHQKEAEKEEKKAHKEAEKEKEKEAEIAALKERREKEKEQARLQKQREEEAEDRKIREERERLTGAAGAGAVAGGAAAAYGETEKEKEKEKEKKPNIFKRIFKRRKNKDTGEDEEYSSDDDPSKVSTDRRRSLQSGTSAKTQEERYDSIPAGQKELAGAYGARVAGHPEDHPYHDNTQAKQRRRSSLVASQIGPDGKTQEEKFDSIPADQKERAGAYGARLAGHPEDHPYHDNSGRRASGAKEPSHSSAAGTAGVLAAGSGYTGTTGTTGLTGPKESAVATGSTSGTSATAVTGHTGPTATTATTTTGTSGTTSYEQASGGAQKPSYNPFSKDSQAETTSAPLQKEAITGLPYDPSKDPEAARRLSSHTHGQGVGTFDKKDATLASSTAAAGTTALGSSPGTTTSGTHGGTTAPTTLDSTGTRSQQPTDAVTGTPATSSTLEAHDKHTAPATTESTGTHTLQPSGSVTGIPTPHSTGTHDTSATGTSGSGINTDFTLGEISDTRR